MSRNQRAKLLKREIQKAEFGLEKECLRVDEFGRLSQTKHPFQDNPHIEKDFCENQVEFITDVFETVDEVYQSLEALHQKAVGTLQNLDTGKEYLWPFSNPPRIEGDEEIPIAIYQGKKKSKEIYRQYLASKYGKRKMLFSGVHLNFSFTKRQMKALYEIDQRKEFREYQNHFYLQLGQKVLEYSWLIVYLTAASSVLDSSYTENQRISNKILYAYASPRCGELGYWNYFDPILKFDSMDAYIESVEAYVTSGKLKSASELYYPVRFKPKGENTLENLRKTGINHIELRMLDLNPYSFVGVEKKDIKFIHLLLRYLCTTKEINLSRNQQREALRNMKQSSMYHMEDLYLHQNGRTVHIQEAALAILEEMKNFYQKEMLAQEILEYQIQKVKNNQQRYGVRIRKEFSKSYQEQSIKLAKRHVESIAQ